MIRRRAALRKLQASSRISIRGLSGVAAFVAAGLLASSPVWAQFVPSSTHFSLAQAAPTTAPATAPASAPADTAPYVPSGFDTPGYEGPTSVKPAFRFQGDDGAIPVPDRWRVGTPDDYVQYRRSGGWWDPYNQNVLKGDYPIWGQDWFLIATAISDTTFETRSLPNPSGVSATDPGQRDFFGRGDQLFFNQNFILSVELFQGSTSYKPRDLEFKATIFQNFNYVAIQEQNLLQPDPADGTTRYDDHFAVQELFVDKHLTNLSVNYDFWAVRAGIQNFNADFRGFLFLDNQPGVRILGNYDNNKLIYNVAWFHTVEKDTNSGLNTWDSREQDLIFANVYREDFIWLGYTAQLSFVMNYDHGRLEFDENDFLARPQPIGTIDEKTNRIYYLGWAGDGHIGWLNISHQFYQAFGTESFNPIVGESTNVNAQFFALELSVDNDWQRYRASFAYSSGDSDPFDDEARGFDSIFDNPNFAGGPFSYFVRQAIPLTGGGTGLVGRNSLYPSLRTSKEQGQANFVNPGLLVYNVGADFEVTPRTKVITNATYLQFADTEVLQQLLFDDKIGRDIGLDLSVGIQYRPLNNQNIVFTIGTAALVPAQGWKDIYTSDTLYSAFFSATLTY
jgi:hypothetical protein